MAHIALVAFLSYFQWQSWLVPSVCSLCLMGNVGSFAVSRGAFMLAEQHSQLQRGQKAWWVCAASWKCSGRSLFFELSVIRKTLGFYPSVLRNHWGLILVPLWVLRSCAALVQATLPLSLCSAVCLSPSSIPSGLLLLLVFAPVLQPWFINLFILSSETSRQVISRCFP